MVNTFHRKMHVNDDFLDSNMATLTQDKERGKSPKEFEDVELQPLLDENDS